MQAGVMRTALWLGVLGATAGPLLDGLHTHGGATRYPHPQLWLAEWWVVPLFSGAALAIGLGRLLSERLLPTPTPSPFMVAAAMAAFIEAYAVSAFSTSAEPVIAAHLMVTFGGAWYLADRSLAGLSAAAVTGFGGWLVEHTLVGQGAFFHRDTGLDGVALWIPPLYFCAACAIGAFAKAVSRRPPQLPKLKPTTSWPP